MNAKLISQEPPGGKRQRLEEKLPLSTPFVVQIFPIYACNFKCKYCHMSIPLKDRGFVTDKTLMDYEAFQRYIDGMLEFPERIKTLRFVGMGEPLLHRDIARMVKYVKDSNVAERTEIITNASLLTPEMSNRIIDAGLDRLVISLQGITAQSYKEVSAIDLDFEEFVSNIRYFYEHKHSTQMYLKIVDIVLEGKDDEQQYFSLFGDITDTIGIETAVPIFPGVEINQELKDKGNLTQFGVVVGKSHICPQPFYTAQINPDGKVVGCHSIPYPAILGDCNINSLPQIWNDKMFNGFRRQMLEGMETVGDICKNCNIMNYRLFTEDDISNSAQRLKQYFTIQ